MWHYYCCFQIEEEKMWENQSKKNEYVFMRTMTTEVYLFSASSFAIQIIFCTFVSMRLLLFIHRFIQIISASSDSFQLQHPKLFWTSFNVCNNKLRQQNHLMKFRHTSYVLSLSFIWYIIIIYYYRFLFPSFRLWIQHQYHFDYNDWFFCAFDCTLFYRIQSKQWRTGNEHSVQIFAIE